MSKRKRSQKAGNKGGEGTGRKSLPLLTFEEYVTSVVREIVASLPVAFTPEDLIQEIHNYLSLSVKEIRLRGKFRIKVKAIDFPKYPNPPHWGENDEILQQDDFKAAERLYTDENLLMLEGHMGRLRKKAATLGINWDTAASIARRIVDKFGPDQRPPAVIRGEFGERIVQELKQIREDTRKFQTFQELESIYPTFEVIHMFKHEPFDSEDRDLLVTPNRWGRLTTYAAGRLELYFNKKPDTIKNDRKQFRAWARRHSSEKR